MNIFQRIGKSVSVLFGAQPAKSLRRYTGASTDRLHEDEPTVPTSIDFDLRNDIGTLLARSRDLEQNNDYGEAYLKAVENNVIGPDGIGLHMKLKLPDGSADVAANAEVERAWRAWGKKKNCTVSGDMTWTQLCRTMARRRAADGGFLLRKYKAFENDFGFAVRPLEIDHLDRYYTGYAPNGNEIRMGVETDAFRKVVAYWIIPRHPGDMIGYAGLYARQRVPADEVIYNFIRTRLEQSRSAPALACSLSRMGRLGRYEQAEVNAAFEESCKGGFIETENPDSYDGSNDGKDNQVRENEERSVITLDPGQKFVEYDPQHPNSAYPEFTRQHLGAFAAGQGVSAMTITGDLRGANYSSMRAGLLPERDQWRKEQNDFCDDICQPVFEEWLPYAILSGFCKVSAARVDEIIDCATWKPRRWGWVDPLKDMGGKILAINNLLDSRQNVIAEAGGTIEEVFSEQKEDKELADLNGLTIVEEPPTEKTAEDPPEDDDKKPGADKKDS